MIDQSFLNEYLPVLLLLGVAFGLALAIIAIPLVTGLTRSYPAKNSQYECGFKVLGKRIEKFDVKFYLISILFIVFDIEIAFLIPWSLILKQMGIATLISGLAFIGVLTVGLAYEWKKGALDS